MLSKDCLRYARRVRSFAPVLVVIAYAACGGAQRRGTSAPEVTVLELGSAPRQRVRIVPVLHAVERVAIVGKLRTDEAVTNTVLETGHRAHDLPSAELVLRCTADEVAVDHARVRCEVESATVNSDTSEPALRTRLAQELEQARGARIAWTLLPNGSFSDVVVDAPHAAARLRERLPMLRTMLRSVAFPDVEIGVGAAWSVTTHERCRA
jgi:hypothetical protein